MNNFIKKIKIKKNISSRFGFGKRFGRNQMLYDFGLCPDDMDDSEKVEEKISEIDKDFDLIMVADRFTESRILLMDLIDIDVEQAACLRLNAL